MEALEEGGEKIPKKSKTYSSGRHGTLFRRGEPSDEMSQLQTLAHAGEMPRVHSKQSALASAICIVQVYLGDVI